MSWSASGLSWLDEDNWGEHFHLRDVEERQVLKEDTERGLPVVEDKPKKKVTVKPTIAVKPTWEGYTDGWYLKHLQGIEERRRQKELSEMEEEEVLTVPVFQKPVVQKPVLMDVVDGVPGEEKNEDLENVVEKVKNEILDGERRKEGLGAMQALYLQKRGMTGYEGITEEEAEEEAWRLVRKMVAKEAAYVASVAAHSDELKVKEPHPVTEADARWLMEHYAKRFGDVWDDKKLDAIVAAELEEQRVRPFNIYETMSTARDWSGERLDRVLEGDWAEGTWFAQGPEVARFALRQGIGATSGALSGAFALFNEPSDELAGEAYYAAHGGDSGFRSLADWSSYYRPGVWEAVQQGYGMVQDEGLGTLVVEMTPLGDLGDIADVPHGWQRVAMLGLALQPFAGAVVGPQYSKYVDPGISVSGEVPGKAIRLTGEAFADALRAAGLYDTRATGIGDGAFALVDRKSEGVYGPAGLYVDPVEYATVHPLAGWSYRHDRPTSQGEVVGAGGEGLWDKVRHRGDKPLLAAEAAALIFSGQLGNVSGYHSSYEVAPEEAAGAGLAGTFREESELISGGVEPDEAALVGETGVVAVQEGVVDGGDGGTVGDFEYSVAGVKVGPAVAVGDGEIVEKVVQVVNEVPVEVIQEVQVEKVLELLKEVPVEKVVEVLKEVPVEVVNEVPVEKVVEVVNEVEVEKVVELITEVPVEKVVEVIKEVEVEVIKEVEVEKIVEIVKEVEVEVVKEIPVEIIKEVEVEKIVEIVKEVPVEIIKEIPVEKIVEVPVEKLVEVVKEVPVEKVVEVLKQAPVEEIIEKTPVELARDVVARPVSPARPRSLVGERRGVLRSEPEPQREMRRRVRPGWGPVEDGAWDESLGVVKPVQVVADVGWRYPVLVDLRSGRTTAWRGGPVPGLEDGHEVVQWGTAPIGRWPVNGFLVGPRGVEDLVGARGV